MASSASTTATSVSCSAPTDSTMTTSSSTMATSYRKSNEHQKTKKSLPELSKEVIADKVLIKSLENYVSAGDRSLLNITRLKKNKNKRKTVHFLDDSDDESQKKVK